MNKRLIAGLILLGAIAAVVAYFVLSGRVETTAPVAAPTQAHDHTARAASGTPRGPVELDTRRQQLIGVRTVVARRATLDTAIRAAGTVTVDETRQSEISTRVDGWIRDLMADYTGRIVRHGEPLFTLYSPDVVATQQEFLLALRGRAASAQDDRGREYSDRLVAAARERLLRLDMAEEDVDQLERTGTVTETITFRSPATGTIVEKAALRGMRVTAGQMLYRVSDLSSVWVEAEIYESDLAAVRTGVRATVTFDAYPQRTFAGLVSFVSPTITPDTRTARVRVSLPNPAGLLKPNMLAEVSIQSPGVSALVVTPDAIVNTGTETLAFLSEGEGRFAPRRVRIGRQSTEGWEVISGLEEGDTVASSATFFLDSESQLRGALENYEPAASAAVSGPAPASTLNVAFRSEPELPKPGDVTLIVSIKDGDKPVTGAEVSVVLSMPAMPAMNMPKIRSETTLGSAGNGTYRGTGLVMTSGRWDVTVTVRQNRQLLGTRRFALITR